MPKGKESCFLLIHGFTGKTHEMKPLAKFLERLGYTTKLLTLPGHETTPEDLRTKKWTEWVDYVQEVVDKARNEYQKVFVSGLSLGGAISLYIAAKNPEIDGIIPISAPITFPNKKIYVIKLLPFLKKLSLRIKNEEKGWEDQNALKEHQCYEYFYIDSIVELERFLQDLNNLLPLVKVPTLLIHSKNDPVVPLSHPKKVLETINTEKKELVIINHGGHIVTEDAGKEEAFEAIKLWLEKLESNDS